jgi:hypothetical protein
LLSNHMMTCPWQLHRMPSQLPSCVSSLPDFDRFIWSLTVF